MKIRDFIYFNGPSGCPMLILKTINIPMAAADEQIQYEDDDIVFSLT